MLGHVFILEDSSHGSFVLIMYRVVEGTGAGIGL
jgi:hypothetical protein